MIPNEKDKKQLLLEPSSIISIKAKTKVEFLKFETGDDYGPRMMIIKPIRTNLSYGDYDHVDKPATRRIEDAKEKITSILRLVVIKNLLLEKILDTITIFLSTCVVVSCWDLYLAIKNHFWESLSTIAIGTLLIYLMRLIPGLVRWPGGMLLKAVYLLHRTVALLQFGHLHGIMYWFTSVVSAGTEVTVFLLHVSCGTMLDTRKQVFWMYRLVMPIIILTLAQPIYFSRCVALDEDYAEYMTTVSIVVLISLLLSYEPVLMLEMFAPAPKNKNIVQTDAIVLEAVVVPIPDSNPTPVIPPEDDNLED